MKKKYFQVALVKPEKPDGYRLIALVDADNAYYATRKAEEKHPGLQAISAEFLCEY